MKLNTFKSHICSRWLIFSVLTLTLFFSACKKYLDEKPSRNMVVPRTLDDLQALLDRHDIMNEESGPGLLEIITDDYYVNSDEWFSSDQFEALNYIWDKDATLYSAWRMAYQKPIYYSNVILDRLTELDVDINSEAYKNIKGAALFYRAFAFYNLAQIYCKPYSNSASEDPGIVLRTTSTIQIESKRASVQQTYDQIIEDLKEAAELLPETTSFPTRPNKAAANGALARTYLSMRDYDNAGLYADLYLQNFGTLIDFNTLDPFSPAPIERFNVETIYYSYLSFHGINDPSYAKIDPTLYSYYDDNDLRKTVFFESNGNGAYYFKGSYDGTLYSGTPFNGIATDEMYLIRAESRARKGQTDLAMEDLNSLLEKRWLAGTFTPISATTAEEALDIILRERRKELFFRGLRWTDLRRYNLEGVNITLQRDLDGTLYTLPPNDLRWVMLIPNEVLIVSNIEQNPR